MPGSNLSLPMWPGASHWTLFFLDLSFLICKKWLVQQLAPRVTEMRPGTEFVLSGLTQVQSLSEPPGLEPGDSVSWGSGSGAGLLSDASLGFVVASLSLPEKWAKNGTCQGFPTGTTGSVLTQAWARPETRLQPAFGRSSYVEGAGGAACRPWCRWGERRLRGAWSAPGGRQGFPNLEPRGISGLRL